jgi:hypothetical protein
MEVICFVATLRALCQLDVPGALAKTAGFQNRASGSWVEITYVHGRSTSRPPFYVTIFLYVHVQRMLF